MFITLDLKHGYFQCLLREKDRPKITFLINFGRGAKQMQYARCPMGLTSSSDHFNTITDEIFSECEGYMKIIDDLLVESENYKQLEQRLCKILMKARENNATFSRDKVPIGPRITFAGMRI